MAETCQPGGTSGWACFVLCSLLCLGCKDGLVRLCVERVGGGSLHYADGECLSVAWRFGFDGFVEVRLASHYRQLGSGLLFFQPYGSYDVRVFLNLDGASFEYDNFDMDAFVRALNVGLSVDVNCQAFSRSFPQTYVVGDLFVRARPIAGFVWGNFFLFVRDSIDPGEGAGRRVAILASRVRW